MICTSIKSCSQEILKWIIQQDEVGEESITDWLLYKLNDLDLNISYQLFNRIQEARTTGADFEFWILTNNFNFKARVQAKRLRQNKDHHSSIAYTNKHGYQIEKLRTDARTNGFRPLYAFYNHERLNSQCRGHIRDEGVYLSCAHTLYRDIIQQPRQVINTQFLMNRSTPFSCWFCCPLCDKLSPKGKTLIDFLKAYHDLGDNEDLPSGITEETPSYVSSFVELKSSDKSNFTSQTWEKEFQMFIKDISGLLVIDKRK
jgi:hypothetical protein